MRLICTFVPALALTSTLALASTATAGAPSTAHRLPLAGRDPVRAEPSEPVQTRTAAPITSDTYANALAQVRSLGQDNSMTRSPDLTQIGQFWSAPIQNYWNEIAQTASLAHHDSVADDARLFALLNTSFADDVIAFYDAKYTYRFWRPVTAINSDGIPADANWAPRCHL
jgi:hypothetical protein